MKKKSVLQGNILVNIIVILTKVMLSFYLDSFYTLECQIAMLKYIKQDLRKNLDIPQLLSHLKMYDLIGIEDCEILSCSDTTKEQKIGWIISELAERQEGFLADLYAYVYDKSNSDINCKKIVQALDKAEKHFKISEFDYTVIYKFWAIPINKYTPPIDDSTSKLYSWIV